MGIPFPFFEITESFRGFGVVRITPRIIYYLPCCVGHPSVNRIHDITPAE